ncbi:hypothetical protein [Niveispirillum irakense]|uniref:hypothetical protein n=1 Tax=Niveispirillum irakense TaxID=34011 RepID=UPI00048B96FE|nr:hypothetical protein [Niveispirillum irakense]
MTDFEAPIAKAVVELGLMQGWEFAAFLETSRGKLIEIRTLMRKDGADPSQDVHAKAAAGAPIVVHHNHLSQESLSFADWNGLATIFDETFAHCADGTIYWGRVLNPCYVKKIVFCSAQKVSMDAENHLFIILNNNPNWTSSAAETASFFRKEVINRAMRLRNFVDYEYSWGKKLLPCGVVGATSAYPAGVNGSKINDFIDQAATQLAPLL